MACDPDTNNCLACGGPGQPCCDGNNCDGGGCCDHNTDTCVGEGNNCSNNQGTCSAGSCQGGSCGALGQECCNNGVSCTADFTDCTNDTCSPCGGLGQRCCDGVGGRYCGSPYACENNTCKTCGGLGELCCPGDVCDGSFTCNPDTSRCQ